MISHGAQSGYAGSIRRIVLICIVMGVGMILFASAVFAKGRILAVGNQCMQYSDGSWRLVAEGPIFPSSVPSRVRLISSWRCRRIRRRARE